jgi:hypothetical protein
MVVDCCLERPSAGATAQRECWRTVAAADYIVRGRLEVPVEKLQTLKAGTSPAFVPLTLKGAAAAKGTEILDILINFVPTERTYAVTTSDVLRLASRDVIGVLVAADVGRPGIYFAYKRSNESCPVLEEFSEGAWTTLRNESLRQARSNPEEGFRRCGSPPRWEEVTRLRNALTDPEKQDAAIAALSAFDSSGVPALIMAMDDRRALGKRSVVIRVPGSFEGQTFYSPELVVDALATVLSVITGESFGDLQNGGSERTRKRVVDGWHTYLGWLRDQGSLPAWCAPGR